MEYNYAQNLPDPKLILNSVYYKHQLNLYVFNSHFGCYGSVLKRREVFETADEYLNIMKNSRTNPSPFEADMSAS